MALEILQIANPCDVPWASMEGDDRTRFCRTCRQHVYDVSALEREEAEALVARVEGPLCLRLTRRADGTVVTRDCAPDRMAALRKATRWSLALGIGLLAGLSMLLGLAGFTLADTPACRYAQDHVETFGERLFAPRRTHVVAAGAIALPPAHRDFDELIGDLDTAPEADR